MKTFLLIPLVLTLFQACSSQSAFSHFGINPQQAKSEETIQSSKIATKNETVGVVSSIYLNAIYPDSYKEYNYFYVSLYVKDEESRVEFFLNDEKALQIEKLATKNRFSFLLTQNTEWKKNYLVLFAKGDEDKKIVKFQVKVEGASSEVMSFQKSD